MTNIRTYVNSSILQIGFVDVGLCREEVPCKCFNAFFLNKLGTRQGKPINYFHHVQKKG